MMFIIGAKPPMRLFQERSIHENGTAGDSFEPAISKSAALPVTSFTGITP
jgi:hypothetical protein